MAEKTRTFVAIAVPEPQSRKLSRLQEELAPDVPGCRWVKNLPFHATLVFLGYLPNSDLSRLCADFAASARKVEPFDVELKCVGAFPGATRPRVIWAGLSANDLTPLFSLQKQISQAAAQFGNRPEERGFHPHVTLGRFKFDRGGTCDLSRLLERYRNWTGGGFRVDEVITFASTLGKAGPRYDPLARAPLADTIFGA
jgi:2'-5' RNA ligase